MWDILWTFTVAGLAAYGAATIALEIWTAWADTRPARVRDIADGWDTINHVTIVTERDK